MQLRSWASDVASDKGIEHFIFLGKGFYYAQCSSLQIVDDLVSKVAIWNKGLLAHIMPWDPSFDLAHEFLFFCPIWIALMLVFLFPHIEEIVSMSG